MLATNAQRTRDTPGRRQFADQPAAQQARHPPDDDYGHHVDQRANRQRRVADGDPLLVVPAFGPHPSDRFAIWVTLRIAVAS